MKGKLVSLFFGGLFLVFAVFAVKDWPEVYQVSKDLLLALSFLTLAYLIFQDERTHVNQKESSVQGTKYAADHLTLIFVEWFSLVLFISFQIIYQFFNHNGIIGLISLTGLFYWSLINVYGIIIGIINR
ncbi:hypothetical protein [Lactiplantibacillus paraplantarum]|uniref:hypothetical protein n=1 Tax=Lactiplantibacillus paraplantarum TaxID=60520 RepID=UPI0023AA589A|nr:hypothetical protein [Lactiplantibacillus paraplantarum]WEE36343.1 hypothetical protein PWO93_01735 [Lactiplantibacillus paraplantarum]